MIGVMVASNQDEGVVAGHARYTYRLRPSTTAHRALLCEWDRCRWVWNECVAASRAAHKARKKCGPAWLDKQLTQWRTTNRLRAGASVPQHQTIRVFAKSRPKALKDTAPVCPCAGAPGCPGSGRRPWQRRH